MPITLQPSRIWIALLAAAHVLAAAAAGWTAAQLPLGAAAAAWLAVIAVIVSGVSNVRRAWSAGPVAAAIAEDMLSLQDRGGNWTAYAVLPDSFVSAYAAALRLKPALGGRTRHWLLLPDALDAEEFRRLRLWLRWRALEQKPA